MKGRKQREAIHHVEQDVATWVRRDLIALLENSPAFAGCRLEVSGVSAGSNRVRVTIGSSFDEASPLALAFEEQSGWLVASVTEPGWLEALDDQRRVVLRGALCGLYKSAGVDLIREESEEVLGPVVPPYDISDAGLVIWPGPGYEVEELRALDPHVFGKRPLRWVDWMASWEAEQEGRERPPLLEGLRVLPG